MLQVSRRPEYLSWTVFKGTVQRSQRQHLPASALGDEVVSFSLAERLEAGANTQFKKHIQQHQASCLTLLTVCLPSLMLFLMLKCILSLLLTI